MKKSSVRNFLILTFAVMISGCSASGPKYMQVRESFPSLSSDKARIYFMRPYQNIYSGADARMKLQGATIGKLPNNGFFFKDIQAGHVVLEVDYWGAPGRYVEHFKIEPGNTYYVLVSNRGSNVVGAAVFGGLGQLGEYAISKGQKDGPFQLLLITREQAMNQIADLAYVGY